MTPTSHATLLARSGVDPWVRWGLPDPLPGRAVLVQDVAVVQRLGVRPGAWVAPLRPGVPPGSLPRDPAARDAETARVEQALTLVRDRGVLASWGAGRVSVPQEHAVVAHRVLELGPGGDWDWMWTVRAPAPDPGEDALVVLDDREDAAELVAFAQRHNPRVWTRIGQGAVVRWVGLRDAEGDLLAVGGAEREDSGVPHLAGILTATGARGRGHGELVSRALTRWAVARHGVCTLGMFSDNDVARRLYQRLGFRTARRWHSRSVLDRLSRGAG